MSAGYGPRTLGREHVFTARWDAQWRAFVRRCGACDGAGHFGSMSQEQCGPCGGEGWIRVPVAVMRRRRRARRRTLQALRRGWRPIDA